MRKERPRLVDGVVALPGAGRMGAPALERERRVHRSAAAELEREVGRLQAEGERGAAQVRPLLQDGAQTVLRDRPLFPIVEEQGELERQRGAIDPQPELDHHGQRTLHVAGAAAVHAAFFAAGREVAFLQRDCIEMASQQQRRPRTRHLSADHRVADALATGLGGDVGGDLRFLANRAADSAELERALREIHQTETPKSRRAELSDVLRSVLSLRAPMISAHGVRYSPAGKLRGRIPGITTLRGGIAPLISFSFAPVTS